MADVGFHKERKLFSVEPDLSFATKKKRKRKQEDDEECKEIKFSFRDNQTLSFQTITEGQTILGCVLNVMNYGLKINLPNRLTGNVAITSISNAYTNLLNKVAEGEEVSESVYKLNDLYTVGHLVAVQVKTIQKGHNQMKLNLSIRPEDVNDCLVGCALTPDYILQCAVVSVEDRGYVLETGVPGIRAAFMDNDSVHGKETLGVGSVFLGRILFIQEMDTTKRTDGTVPMQVKITNKLSSNVTPVTEDTNIMSILPGSLLDAEVTSVTKFGLKLKTSLNTEGFVSENHLMKANDFLSNYNESQPVLVRLLYRTNFTHLMHFSMNNMLVKGKVSQKASLKFTANSLVDCAKIVSSGKSGVIVHVDQKYKGFCPPSSMVHGNIKHLKVSEVFPIGKEVRCHIAWFSLIDQMFKIGLHKEALVDENGPSLSDFEPGMDIDATVKNLNTAGVVFSVTQKIEGLAKFIDLTESSTKDIEPLFPIGKVMPVRVLGSFKKELCLTLKPGLIESSLPIVANYDESLCDTVTQGLIVHVTASGLLIRFYNNVTGYLHKKKLSSADRDSIDQSFKAGQVIQCKVIHVDKEGKRMTLDLPFSEERKSVKRKMAEGPVSMDELKKSYSCEVKGIKKEGISVKLDGLSCPALIPTSHLSDSLDLCSALKGAFSKGDHIENCHIFSVMKNGSTVIVTFKPSINRYILNLCEDESELELNIDDVIPAVVMSVFPEKLKVSLPRLKCRAASCLVLLEDCQLGKLSKSKVNFRTMGVKPGQTLSVKCLVGGGTMPKLSIDLNDIKPNRSETAVEFVVDRLKTEGILRDSFKNQGGLLNLLSTIKMGENFNGRITAYVKKFGFLVSIGVKNNQYIDGVIVCTKKNRAKLSIGRNVEVTVVHVDLINQCLHLTEKIGKESGQSGKFKVGSVFRGDIVAVLREFVVVFCKNVFVYVYTISHLNDFSYPHSKYFVGGSLKVRILYKDGAILIGEFVAYSELIDGKVEVKECDSSVSFKTQKSNFNQDISLPLDSITYSVDAQNKIHKVFEHLYLGRSLGKYNSLMKEKFHQYSNKFSAEIGRLRHAQDPSFKIETKNSKPNENSLTPSDISEDEECITNHAEIDDSDGDAVLSSNCEEVIPIIKSKKKKSQNDGTLKHKKSNTIKTKMEDKALKPLSLDDSGFSWFEDSKNMISKPLTKYDSSSDEEEEAKGHQKIKKLSKAERLQKVIQEESRVHQTEMTRLKKEREPESAMDYEELIQSSPNSSAIWIQYISFHLQNAEVEKARSVGRRALQIISHTEEKERINVWTVVLRLEVLYGDRDSVDEALKEALATNDEKKIYRAMALVYSDSDKGKEAEGIYKIMMKKFKQDCTVLIEAMLFFFKKSNPEKARAWLDKSLQTLPANERVDVTHRYAQFEYQHGDSEKGRTVYESLVSNFPKRVDIWGVYVDMLTKHEDIEGARRVLERMTLLKLRLPKMRSIFKRLLQFEEQHGSAQSVEEVKKKVEEYVTAALKEDV